MRRTHVLVPLAVLLTLAGCRSIPEPGGIDDPLPTATLESAGLSRGPFSALERQLESVDHELHSVLVARGGALVYERYFGGYGPHTTHDLRSATKSLTAMLTGLAIRDGIIGSVDESIGPALGADYPAASDTRLRYEDLLTMRTGRPCNDHDRRSPGRENRMYRRRDWTDFFLALPEVADPGTRAVYCTGGVVTLGRAIQAAANEPFDEWADRVFFAPLGIRTYRWEYYDRGRGVDTGGHLHLTPRGLLRVGMMLLDGGRWNGAQVVPRAWITEMWQPRTTLAGADYGYLWWIHEMVLDTQPVRVYSARGNGGQALFVIPSLDIAAVVTAGYFNDERAAIADQILAGVVLAFNPSGRSRRRATPQWTAGRGPGESRGIRRR